MHVSRSKKCDWSGELERLALLSRCSSNEGQNGFKIATNSSFIHSRRKSKTKTAISRSKRNEKSSFDSENVSFSEIYPRNMSNRQIKIFDFFWSDFVVKMFPSSKVVFQNASQVLEILFRYFTFYTTIWPNFWREIDWDHLFLIWSWIDAAKPDFWFFQLLTINIRFWRCFSKPFRLPIGFVDVAWGPNACF